MNDQEYDGIENESDQDGPGGVNDIQSQRATSGQLVKLIDETVDLRLPESVEGKWQFVTASLLHAENALMGAGMALIKLKHEIGHGKFQNELKRHRINEKAARRLMAAARTVLRLPDSARGPSLAWSKQKLLVLSTLTTDELEQIAEDSGPCGLTLAEIELRPARELLEIIQRERRRGKHAEDEKVRLIEENHHLQEELATARGQAPSRDDAASIEVQRLRESQAQLEQLLDALRPDRFTDAGTAIQRRAREIVVFARMRVATIEADWNELRGEDTSVYLVPVSDQLPDARIAAVQQHEKVRALLETGAPESIIERPRRVK